MGDLGPHYSSDEIKLQLVSEPFTFIYNWTSCPLKYHCPGIYRRDILRRRAKEEDGAVIEGMDIQGHWDTGVNIISTLTSWVADEADEVCVL